MRSSVLLPAPYPEREFERKAIRIRRFAGIRRLEPLDPFALAVKVRIRLASLNQPLPEICRRLICEDADKWSGGVTPMLPDGYRIVILNPMHSQQRQLATLMEEICHILLGHRADRLGVGGVKGRDYNVWQEMEAYGVGAAVLVPYLALLESLEEGMVRTLATRYGVSQALVSYRFRVTGLLTAT